MCWEHLCVWAGIHRAFGACTLGHGACMAAMVAAAAGVVGATCWRLHIAIVGGAVNERCIADWHHACPLSGRATG